MEHQPSQHRPTPETNLPPVAEKIASQEPAALLFKGKLYRGTHHADALVKLSRDYPEWEDSDSDLIQDGFVTEAGRFIDRKEAASLSGVATDELDSYDINPAPPQEFFH